jgi:hypothetical protein
MHQFATDCTWKEKDLDATGRGSNRKRYRKNSRDSPSKQPFTSRVLEDEK